MSSKSLLRKLESISKGTMNPTDHEEIANTMRAATSPLCSDVVATVKKALKREKLSPEIKLHFLKVFCACMRVNNAHFVAAAERKILRRLAVFAAHRPGNADPRRGMDLFKSVVMEQIVASQEFLMTLLEGIEEWAYALGDLYPAYRSTYQELLTNGVVFPKYSDKDAAVNRLRKLRTSLLVKDLQSKIRSEEPNAEEIAAYVQVIGERRNTLQQSLSTGTMETVKLEQVFSKLEALAKLIESAEKAMKPRDVPRALPAKAAVDRSAELLKQAASQWATIPEPVALPGPSPQAEEDSEMEIAFRPDLVLPAGLESPSIFHKPSYQTIRNKVENRFGATRRLQDVLEAVHINNSQLTPLLDKVEELKRKKKELEDSLQAANERIQELEKAAAQSGLVPQACPDSPHFAVSVAAMPSFDLLDIESPASGLPSIHIEPGLMSLPSQREEAEMEVLDPVNDDFYMHSCSWSQGTLYDDLGLSVFASVLFEDRRGTVVVVVTNKSTAPFADFRLSLQDLSTLQVTLESPPPNPTLEPGSQYRAQLAVMCSQAFLDPPLMILRYRSKSTPFTRVLRLPVSITRFIQPYTDSVKEASALLKTLKQFSDRVKFSGLRSDLRNMKEVAEVFGCNGAFHLYLPSETDIPRTIIGVGWGLGVSLIAKVTLSERAEQVELFCCCEDVTLRSSVLQQLRWQLEERVVHEV